jgi:hypothetical protein
MNIIIMVWMKIQLMDEYYCKFIMSLEITTRWGNEMDGEDGGYAAVEVEMMPNPPRIFIVLKIRCPVLVPLQIPSEGSTSYGVSGCLISDLSSHGKTI